ARPRGPARQQRGQGVGGRRRGPGHRPGAARTARAGSTAGLRPREEGKPGVPTRDVGDEDRVDGSRRRAPQALPVTFRPRNIRFVAYGLAVLIMATMAALAVIMPEGWGLQDRIFLLLLGVAIGGGLRFL